VQRGWSSFIGEHTAEFPMVSRLRSALNRAGLPVVAFFHWADREGSSMSRACDDGAPIRIVAAYPRRPKVAEPGATAIEMKVNRLLFEHARALHSEEIPVLACVPLVDTIWALGNDPACACFLIAGSGPTDEDVVVTIDLAGEVCTGLPADMRGPLPDDELVSIAMGAKAQTWTDTLRSIKTNRPTEGMSLFGYRYRPVYLAIRER
jgi:hypothetical protein